MEKKEIKYYRVSLSDGVEKNIADGFSTLTNSFKELMTVDAKEEDGVLVEIITGNKILLSGDGNNPNIFDVRTFVEGGYDLFGIKKTELSLDELKQNIITESNNENNKENNDENNDKKNDKNEIRKYYTVSLSDGVTKNDSDGFKELMKVHAYEEGGVLVEILTGAKILEVDKSNSNIFDGRIFLEKGYGLFGIKKIDLEVIDMLEKFKFLSGVQARVNDEFKKILEIQRATMAEANRIYNETKEEVDRIGLVTKEEANRQYKALLAAERNFAEEINQGRRK